MNYECNVHQSQSFVPIVGQKNSKRHNTCVFLSAPALPNSSAFVPSEVTSLKHVCLPQSINATLFMWYFFTVSKLLMLAEAAVCF